MNVMRISGHLKEIEPSSRLNGPAEPSCIATLQSSMPHLVRHEGCWEGSYCHIDVEGQVVGQHSSRVECIFPADGHFQYIHRETITSCDGKQETDIAHAVFQDDRLWIHNDKFDGFAMEIKSGAVLFNLTYRNDLRRSLKEILCLDSGRRSRSRMLEWFEDGRLVKRSLSNETRVDIERDFSG